MLKAILFDLVDTLVNSTKSIEIDKGPYEVYRSLENDGISVDWPSFAKKYNQIRNRQRAKAKQTLKEYDMGKRVSETLQFFNYKIPPTAKIIQKALDAYMLLLIDFLQIDQSTYSLLGELMAKYKLGLVTNFAYCPGAHQILDRFKLRQYFKVIVISGEVGWKKPSKKIFNIALTKLSTVAEEAVFVGNDYEADIQGAVNAGIASVWLNRTNESLNPETLKPNFEIGSLSELVYVLL